MLICMLRQLAFIALVLGCVLAAAQPAWACAACKESLDEQQGRAYGWSVLFMLGTMVTLLGGFGTTFFVMYRREARRRARAASNFPGEEAAAGSLPT